MANTRRDPNLPVPAYLWTDKVAWKEGADLALLMLGEAANAADDMSLDSDCREGRPQYNVVLRYMKVLRTLNDPRIDRAFCAVLTDYISGGESGGVPDVSLLRKLSRKPIATTTEVSHG